MGPKYRQAGPGTHQHVFFLFVKGIVVIQVERQDTEDDDVIEDEPPGIKSMEGVL
jgi:hypothetical protein